MLNFWHWLTTSKAERLLEAQIADLKRERELLVNQVLRLEEALIPALRMMEREKAQAIVPPATAADIIDRKRERAQQKAPPIVTNWIQARDRMEHASDETGERFERAQEAHKEL